MPADKDHKNLKNDQNDGSQKNDNKHNVTTENNSRSAECNKNQTNKRKVNAKQPRNHSKIKKNDSSGLRSILHRRKNSSDNTKEPKGKKNKYQDNKTNVWHHKLLSNKPIPKHQLSPISYHSETKPIEKEQLAVRFSDKENYEKAKLCRKSPTRSPTRSRTQRHLESEGRLDEKLDEIKSKYPERPYPNERCRKRSADNRHRYFGNPDKRFSSEYYFKNKGKINQHYQLPDTTSEEIMYRKNQHTKKTKSTLKPKERRVIRISKYPHRGPNCMGSTDYPDYPDLIYYEDEEEDTHYNQHYNNCAGDTYIVENSDDPLPPHSQPDEQANGQLNDGAKGRAKGKEKGRKKGRNSKTKGHPNGQANGKSNKKETKKHNPYFEEFKQQFSCNPPKPIECDQMSTISNYYEPPKLAKLKWCEIFCYPYYLLTRMCDLCVPLCNSTNPFLVCYLIINSLLCKFCSLCRFDATVAQLFLHKLFVVLALGGFTFLLYVYILKDRFNVYLERSDNSTMANDSFTNILNLNSTGF